MPISGVPEKQSSVKIMDNVVLSTDMQDRTIVEQIRWQYWVTVGVVIKAGNEGYDESAVTSAMLSVSLLCSFVENYYGNSKAFFEAKVKLLNDYINRLVGDKSDKTKAKMIIECTDILRHINKVLSENGEKILSDAIGEM